MGTIALRLRALRRSWSSGHGKKGAPVWARPAVEALEERWVLDALFLTWNALESGNWSVQGNWVDTITRQEAPREPRDGDRLIFDGTSVENSTNDILDLELKSLTVTSQYSGEGKGIITLQEDLAVTHTVSIGGGTIGGTPAGLLTVYNSIDNTPSSFTWSGGELAMDVHLNLGASLVRPTLSIEGTANKTFGGLEFVSEADAAWTGGDIISSFGGTFYNEGTFDVRVDKSFKSVGDPPGSRSAFVNRGTFKKTITAGTTTIEAEFDNFGGEVLFSSGTVAFTDDFGQNGGTTTLNGGNVQTTQAFLLADGTLTGVGTITGSVENEGGNVIPGLNGGPGTLNITGNYTQDAGGTLTININATGGYGVLNVQGTANLDGHLQVNKDPAYKPEEADLVFLHYDSFTGDFGTWSVTNSPWFIGGTPWLFTPSQEQDGYHLRSEILG